MATDWFTVKGHDKEFYCKVQTILQYNANPMYTISFGSKTEFCVTIAIKLDTVAYIDRVEYNELCVKDGVLPDGGTASIVSVALWTIKKLFPSIETFTLTDDSYLYCKAKCQSQGHSQMGVDSYLCGTLPLELMPKSDHEVVLTLAQSGIKKSKEYKLSLAYDYIVKYGETWYEKKFKAVLPDKFYSDYKDSHKVLDLPLDPFEYQSSRAPFLIKYKDIYSSMKTPREFITSLREIYGKDYCKEVGPWLNRYMECLKIVMFKDSWLIHIPTVLQPEGYELTKLTKVPLNQPRGGSRKTRKVQKNNDGSCHGYWNAEENY